MASGKRRPVGQTIEQFSHFAQRESEGEPEDARPNLQALPQPQDSGDPSEHEPGLVGEEEGSIDELMGETTSEAPEVVAVGERAIPKAPAVRQRGARRHDVVLSDRLMSDLRELGRPERTGAQRTIGAKHFAAVYVQAVHELLGDSVDTSGLDVDTHDEAVERVKRALLDLAAQARDEHAAS